MSRRNKREQQSFIAPHEPSDVEPVDDEHVEDEPVEDEPVEAVFDEPALDEPEWYRVCSAGTLVTSYGLQVSVRPGKLVLPCDRQMYVDAGFELEPWLG